MKNKNEKPKLQKNTAKNEKLSQKNNSQKT